MKQFLSLLFFASLQFTAQSQNSEPAITLQQQARAYMQQSRFDDAIQTLNQALVLDSIISS